mmetsp:Transcript_489/g.833  ORF Transcript_489/g.833 Transcript_489/m.833 type:complete len:80 (+) Transcript_489:11-250(+)
MNGWMNGWMNESYRPHSMGYNAAVVLFPILRKKMGNVIEYGMYRIMYKKNETRVFDGKKMTMTIYTDTEMHTYPFLRNR